MSDIAFLVMIFCAKFTEKNGLRGLLRGSFFFSTEIMVKFFFKQISVSVLTFVFGCDIISLK